MPEEVDGEEEEIWAEEHVHDVVGHHHPFVGYEDLDDFDVEHFEVI